MCHTSRVGRVVTVGQIRRHIEHELGIALECLLDFIIGDIVVADSGE